MYLTLYFVVFWFAVLFWDATFGRQLSFLESRIYHFAFSALHVFPTDTA